METSCLIIFHIMRLWEITIIPLPNRWKMESKQKEHHICNHLQSLDHTIQSFPYLYM